MIARHVSTEAHPGDRGRALGRETRDAIAVTTSVYRRMFSEDVGLDEPEVLRRGDEVGAALARVRPDLVDEICAVAEGADVPPALMLAVNARTELLAGGTVAGVPAGGGECSVAASVGAGADGRPVVLAQTWDFHPDLHGARLLWIVRPPGGTGWATFTEAGILAKTGINARGLAVTLNFLASRGDGGTAGVPIHVLVRWLLDGCATVDEAERLLAAATRSASGCLTVGARQPGARGRHVAAFELRPGGLGVQPPTAGRLAHTNHFLDEPAGTDQRNSVARLAQLERGLAAAPPGAVEPILELLSSDTDPTDPVFRRDAGAVPWLERCATLATVAYELRERRMWLRTGLDSAAPFAEVALDDLGPA